VLTITSGGVATGFIAGVAVITYDVSGVDATISVTVDPAPAPITGSSSICQGSITTFVAPGGGVWSSSTGVATIGSATGIATGITVGVTNILYTLSTGCSAAKTVTVVATPAAITGSSTICAGGTDVLGDATTGGTWSSTSSAVVTIGAGTGVAVGIAAGVATISYASSTGCFTTMTVTVEPTPTAYAMTGGGPYCSGTSGVHLGLVYGATGTSYQLYDGSTPVGASVAGSGSAIDFGLFTTPGTYTVAATSSSTTCSGTMTGSETIFTFPLPTVYSVAGGGTYCTGGSGVHITLSGSTAGVDYTLYSSGSIVSTLAGTGSALDFGVFTIAGTYTIVATNSTTGCTSNMSGSAVIAVSALPTAYGVIASSYCASGPGTDVTTSGSATGVSYQLYSGATAIGSPIAGTGAALDFGVHPYSSFSMVATSASTGCTVTTTATVVVDPSPTIYPMTGGGSYCSGTSGVHLGLAFGSTGVSYQLFDGTSAVGAAVLGTGASLDFGIFTTSGTYTAVATNTSSGCTATMSGSSVIGVSALPTTYTVAGGGSYCSGGTGVHISLSGSSTGISYQLYLGGAAVGAAITGTGSSLDFGLFTVAGTYTIIATNTSTGCTSNMAGSAVISVSSLPGIYTLTGGGVYCPGGTGAHIELSGSNTGISYQLYRADTSVGAAMAGTGSLLDFGMFTIPGTYSAVATNTITGCQSSMTGFDTVSFAVITTYSVGGGGSYCPGTSGADISLSSSTIGMYYQLYNGSTAIGSAVAGTGSLLDFGFHTSAGSYTIVGTDVSSGCMESMTGTAAISISALPVVHNVTGGGSYCAGGTGVHIGLDASDAGVSYQLYNGTTAVGTVLAGTGSPLDFGLETLAGTYTVEAINPTTSCTSNMTGTAIISIIPLSTPTIAITPTPGSTVCTGTSVSFSTTITGGGSTPAYGWSINGVAIVGATSSTFSWTPFNGDVVGVDMTTSAACATTTSTSTSLTMTVITTTVTATAAEATCGGSYTLTGGGASSYSWSPATGLSCTACGAPTCSGLSSSATYVVTGTDTHGCTGTASVTPNFNRVYGHITYTGGVSTDVFKVWLIQFNPSDSSITALDSVNSCMDAGIPYYEFSSPASGSYMAKAKLDGTVAGSSGYIPTYSSSTPNWYSAASATHTTGADALDITMVYGTVPPGPGFISGYISAGAGRGTSGDVPAVGMIVYLKDASGSVLTYTYTDATGMYSFSSLANGTYMIYPENYAFYTTPSAVITLTSSNESITGIDFKQHNTSGTITPIDATAVQTIAAQDFNIYPNPATGNLNIQWANKTIGTATVTISDITGRTVLSSGININSASGHSQLNVSDLNNGIYLISITSASSTYNTKIVIQN
jgi:hypothetical protein